MPRMCFKHLILLLIFVAEFFPVRAQQIKIAGEPGQLNIRAASNSCIRITLKPASFKDDFPFNPAVDEREYPAPVISIEKIDKPVKKKIGNLEVEVKSGPLRINVMNDKGEFIQEITFADNGNLLFKLDEKPVLGMGEGGPLPVKGEDWRTQPVQFDRKGQYDEMQPRWQGDAYGSRNPVSLLIGTKGWGLFVTSPWVQVDLRDKDNGIFIPWKKPERNVSEGNNQGQGADPEKGRLPFDKIIPGLYDFFVFDAHDPAQFMKDVSIITGQAVLPPEWALGYMQSHRTLENDKQMIDIVKTFRAKQIPIDAVIYLGTGFCPRGWNTQQPSFDFNPETFTRDPADVISDLHKLNVKVVLHIISWSRDKLPALTGTIPPKPGEIVNDSHILSYWMQHKGLEDAGADGYWPDGGDWFNLPERLERHQLYYQGPLLDKPNIRPWDLQRNGYIGIAKWGGWVWSGDTQSSWKTLEAQIAVGINYSLSLSPFWGSDIGGFTPSEELTGELFARWYQFGAFCPSFRSHGRTWWTRLPWGWGLNDMGPLEGKNNPLKSELNNPAIEPVCKKYTDLRYQLLPYNYTLAWEARNTGMPMMRAMWLHYPDDPAAIRIGSQYLWGRDMLIAPVFVKGAASREVYLPEGEWYDWWTNKQENGGRVITRKIDLSIMPIYVRAGAIIPFDPVRQYTSQEVKDPTTIKVFRGANGQFTLYEDDGISLDYLEGKSRLTNFYWNDRGKQLTIESGPSKGYKDEINSRTFKIQLIPDNEVKTVIFKGQPLEVNF